MDDWTKNFTALADDAKSEMRHYVGGIDVSFVKGDQETACAAFVVLSYPDLEVD